MNRIGMLCVAAIVPLLAGCEERADGLGPGLSNSDRTRPTVVSTAPSDQATQVTITNPITVSFSEPVRAKSATTPPISVSPATAGTVIVSGPTATFTPAVALAGGTVYTVTVSTGVEDLAGNDLAAPFTWSFTTGVPQPIVP
jgi:hypothetical protein